jgi:hypothetical protein
MDEKRKVAQWRRRLLGQSKTDIRVEDGEEQLLPFEEESTWPTK